MNIVIEQGRIICPLQNIDTVDSLYIQEGRILSIGEPSHTFVPDKIINAKEHLVIPGLVDGYGYYKNEQGETCQKQIDLAARSGYTQLFCSPVGTLSTDTPSRAEKVSKTPSLICVHPIGALTTGLSGEGIADLTALYDAGCFVFTQDLIPIKDLNILRNSYHYAASFDLKVVIFPLEHSLAQGVIHEGLVSATMGLKGIPETAETIAISQHLHLIEETGVRAHFTHITCAKSVELIKQAQASHLPVTADCTMHHCHLTEVDVMELNPNTHVIPPLRSTTDKAALLKGLEDGILSGITSSHKPLPRLAKNAPFAQTTPGISMIPTMLSLGLHLVQEKALSLKTLVKSLTSAPMKAYLNQDYGLVPGQSADVCIVNPNEYWTVEALAPNNTNTPFMGWELPGKIRFTLKSGEVLFEKESHESV